MISGIGSQNLCQRVVALQVFYKKTCCISLKWLPKIIRIMFRHPYGTPTFKTEALHLVSNVQQLKRFLLLYERLIQRYLNLLWL